MPPDPTRTPFFAFCPLQLTSIKRSQNRLTLPTISATKSNTMSFNIRHRRAPTALEQVILDYVWAHSQCTAEMCREGLASQRPLKDSTIRTILRNLEQKGYVVHDVDGRTYVYRATETKRNIAVKAVHQLIDRLCNGSVEELLVGMVDNQLLEAKQLQRLAEKIASRREKKS